MAAVRLRQALDRALAVFTISTSTHHAQASDDSNAAALAVVVTNSSGSEGPLGSSADPIFSAGEAATVTTTITRPADTAIYAANDALADSTSAPTAGGFTLASSARASGKSGLITDMVVVSSVDPGTLLQGEVWIFDSSVTAINDNAAFALSDGDAVKLIGVVPFALSTTTAGSGTNSYALVTGLNIGFTAVGSADLRFLVKVKNAYTPASGEQITIRAKIVQTN